MEEKIVKTGWNVANMAHQNSPKIASTIGNILLAIGTVGGLIAIAPISTPLLVTIGTWCAFAGLVGKTITKGWGTNIENPDGSKTPLAPIGSAVVTDGSVVHVTETPLGVINK